MSPRHAYVGALVAVLDPPRLAYQLTRGGRLPLIGPDQHPAPVSCLRERGQLVQLSEARALVAFPSAPFGLWLDLAELTGALDS